MACLEYWADPTDYAEFWCVNVTEVAEIEQVRNYLARAASSINMVMQSSGQCDCTLTATSLRYLRDLSIVMAVVYHSCPCARPNVSVEEKRMYLEQVGSELDQLRQGKLELCDGHTGSEFPAIGIAQQAWTVPTTLQIIRNEELETS